MSSIHRVVRVIQPWIPGIDRTNCCARIGRIAGSPYTVNNKGVIGPIDCHADGIVVGYCVSPKVGGEIVGRGRAAGPINPVVKPVWLRTGADRCIVPCTIGDGTRISSEIATDIRLDIAPTSTPGTGSRIEPVMNGFLRVVPLWSTSIVIKPIVDLNSSYVGNTTPISLMLIPIVGSSIHPGMVRSIKIVAR